MMSVRCEGAGEESVEEAELTFTALELVTETSSLSESDTCSNKQPIRERHQ